MEEARSVVGTLKRCDYLESDFYEGKEIQIFCIHPEVTKTFNCPFGAEVECDLNAHLRNLGGELQLEIKVEATGGPNSGKTYILTRVRQLLEDLNMSVEFSGAKCDILHEHTLVATRPDDWVRKFVARR